MKKMLAVLVVVFLLCGQWQSFAASRLSGTTHTTHVSGQDNSNATVTPVSATSGRSIRIYKIFYKTGGADHVTLSCGATPKAKSKYTFGAEGGIMMDLYPLYIECDANTALTLTKATAGTLLEYDVWYDKEAD